MVSVLKFGFILANVRGRDMFSTRVEISLLFQDSCHVFCLSILFINITFCASNEHYSTFCSKKKMTPLGKRSRKDDSTMHSKSMFKCMRLYCGIDRIKLWVIGLPLWVNARGRCRMNI